uniref:Rossmann fold nucleotide-binding protein-like protein n=1 Tax=uncultured bacterium 213 TaxID=698383 RepID=E3T6W1_9BACT|nr:Rossmann fold nucleotide-binding protein-like protein [uncultured bacterium 213]
MHFRATIAAHRVVGCERVGTAEFPFESMSVVNVKRRIDLDVRHRRRVVTVVGSGRTADPCCAEVGRTIATLGYDLLTGGGRGVMEAVSRAFFETTPRRGLVIGVIPALVEPLARLEWRQPTAVEYDVPRGYPNEWVELAIYTHLPDSGPEGTLRSSRNHINVLSADVMIALPGREGTAAEIWLATQYGVPIVAYGDHHEEVAQGVRRATSIDDVSGFLVEHLGRPSWA